MRHPLFHQPTLTKEVTRNCRKHAQLWWKSLASGLGSAADCVILHMSLKHTLPRVLICGIKKLYIPSLPNGMLGNQTNWSMRENESTFPSMFYTHKWRIITQFFFWILYTKNILLTNGTYYMNKSSILAPKLIFL